MTFVVVDGGGGAIFLLTESQVSECACVCVCVKSYCYFKVIVVVRLNTVLHTRVHKWPLPVQIVRWNTTLRCDWKMWRDRPFDSNNEKKN